MTNRRVLIDSLPKERLSEDNFKIVEDRIPSIEENEVLCRTLLVTIAAGSRAGLQGSASYAGAPQAGVVMNATGVCRIEASKSEKFLEGDLVVCQSGWQDYSSQKATHCQKIVNDINHTMKYCKQSFQPSSCILEAIKELNNTLLTVSKTPSE